jgi:SAM-dependent methyltransferase
MTDTSTFRGADPTYRLVDSLHAQEKDGSRNLVQNFLLPLLERLSVRPGARILDVGCGIGQTVSSLREAGYDAYGLEPGGRYDEAGSTVKPFLFQQYSNDFSPTEKFDFVMSHGVIEHVGTTDGHASLSLNYMHERRLFAESLAVLTKRGGYVLICCPNRLFPFDFQHGPHIYGGLAALKARFPLLRRITIPWHSQNNLCSLTDIANLMGSIDGATIPVPQGMYLNLGSLRNKPLIAGLFRSYIRLVDALPRTFWKALHTHTLFLMQIGNRK